MTLEDRIKAREEELLKRARRDGHFGGDTGVLEQLFRGLVREVVGLEIIIDDMKKDHYHTYKELDRRIDKLVDNFNRR